MKTQISSLHKLPSDLSKALNSSPKILELWNSLTPLAKNEFICYVISVKKKEARKQHIERACEDLMNGKRRPCCWPGCTHRKDKPTSSSQKFILGKRR